MCILHGDSRWLLLSSFLLKRLSNIKLFLVVFLCFNIDPPPCPSSPHFSSSLTVLLLLFFFSPWSIDTVCDNSRLMGIKRYTETSRSPPKHLPCSPELRKSAGGNEGAEKMSLCRLLERRSVFFGGVDGIPNTSLDDSLWSSKHPSLLTPWLPCFHIFERVCIVWLQARNCWSFKVFFL